jgi:hypothetical protein
VREDRSIFLWYRGDREVITLSKLSRVLKVSSSLSTAREVIVNNGEGALGFL